MKSTIHPCFRRKWLGGALLSSLLAVGLVALNTGLAPAGHTIGVDHTTPAGDTSPAGDPAPAAGHRVASQDEAAVERAVADATCRIQKLAVTDPGAFAAVLRQAFGVRIDADVERDLVEQATHGQLPLPGRIVFVPADVLPGADAAYASENGGVIFISATFRSDAWALQELIIHEWGHHLDAVLGSGDSPVEEGAVFLLGVNHGGPIPADVLQASLAEGRAIVIEFEGRTIAVECGFFDFFKKAGNWIAGAAKTVGKAAVNIGKAVGNTVVNFAKSSVSQIKNAALAVGNVALGVGRGIASGVMAAAGNKKASAKLAADARGAFKGSWTDIKATAKDTVDKIAVVGDLYNKTTSELNKVIPHLGTALDFAAGFTPAGPYIAGFKGVANVNNVVKNGGNFGQIAGAVGHAALDLGGGVLGNIGKGAGKIAKVAKVVKHLKHGKHFIPGRDTDKDGKLLGTGGSTFDKVKPYIPIPTMGSLGDPKKRPNRTEPAPPIQKPTVQQPLPTTQVKRPSGTRLRRKPGPGVGSPPPGVTKRPKQPRPNTTVNTKPTRPTSQHPITKRPKQPRPNTTVNTGRTRPTSQHPPRVKKPPLAEGEICPDCGKSPCVCPVNDESMPGEEVCPDCGQSPCVCPVDDESMPGEETGDDEDDESMPVEETGDYEDDESMDDESSDDDESMDDEDSDDDESTDDEEYEDSESMPVGAGEDE